ncbi:MAG: RNA 2',3'-cyclic phosphodiesterase [Thermodesulfobacteriota bacterium]|nr:RNA 2',3'-cyclic phosphodiesterase [Thermodesulfobacteriota bacterium]
MPKIRAFIALSLPQEYQDGLAELTQSQKRKLRSKLSWTRPGNWHLTLKFLGDVEEKQVGAIKRFLSGVRFKAFTLQAGGADSFPPGRTPRVLWVRIRQGREECEGLAKAVEKALVPMGFKRERRGFSPHLTLARVRQAASDPWDEILKDISALSWPAFTVDSFALHQSVLRPQGPTYTALADFQASPESAIPGNRPG